MFETDDGTGNYEKRVKIIRNDSLGNKKWNASNINEWVGSTMQSYLNDTYIINELSFKMISDNKWYLGGRQDESENAEGFYISERSEIVLDVDHSKNWTGKIGLMYPSDYLFPYALEVDNICYNTFRACRYSISTSGWLYQNEFSQWTITSNSSNTYVFYVYILGGVTSYTGEAKNFAGTRPVLYLKPNVKIISGDGTSSDSYVFEL